MNRSLGGESGLLAIVSSSFLRIPGLAVAAAASSRSARETETSPAKEAEKGAAAAEEAEEGAAAAAEPPEQPQPPPPPEELGAEKTLGRKEEEVEGVWPPPPPPQQPPSPPPADDVIARRRRATGTMLRAVTAPAGSFCVAAALVRRELSIGEKEREGARERGKVECFCRERSLQDKVIELEKIDQQQSTGEKKKKNSR